MSIIAILLVIAGALYVLGGDDAPRRQSAARLESVKEQTCARGGVSTTGRSQRQDDDIPR